MKNLSDVVKNERPVSFELQDNVVGSLSKEQLEEYLNITSKFLMNETKMVINWMLAAPQVPTSIELANIINNGLPKEEGTITELYKNLKAIVKSGHALEIPLFLTVDQFNAIINQKESLDSIVLDLETEAGKNAIAKQYNPLVWKIARQYANKCELSLEDIYGAGCYGLSYAIATYGKPRKQKAEPEMDNNEEIEYTKAVKSLTFKEYAGNMIRVWILEEIKKAGHTVRIPASVQSRDRKEGRPGIKSNSISLDTVVGTDKDGNVRTLMDKIPDYENPARDSDEKDEDTLLKMIYDKLDNKGISDRDLDIFYSSIGINGHKEEKKHDIAARYSIGPSTITHINKKIQKAILEDPELMELFSDLYRHIAECRNEEDAANRGYEPLHINESYSNNPNDDED